MIVRVAPAGTTPSAHGKAVVQSPAFDTNTRPVGVASLTDDARGIGRPGVGDGDRVDQRVAGDDGRLVTVLVMPTSAAVLMASRSVAIAEVRLA